MCRNANEEQPKKLSREEIQKRIDIMVEREYIHLMDLGFDSEQAKKIAPFNVGKDFYKVGVRWPGMPDYENMKELWE